MRRLIDSLLLVLVAYSVTWPLVRSLGDDGATRNGTASSPAVLQIQGGGLPEARPLDVILRWDSGTQRLDARSGPDGSLDLSVDLDAAAEAAGALQVEIVDDAGAILGSTECDAATGIARIAGSR